MRNLTKSLGAAGVAALVLACLVLAFPASQSLASINQSNEAKYVHDISTPCSPYETVTNSSGTFSVDMGGCGKANVVVGTNDTQANATMVQAGWWASCLSSCSSVTYREDPAALMTNDGHDFMFNCKDFGTSSVITCTSTDKALDMMLSTSSSSLGVTDTGCGGGSGSGQITTGGLADAAGTFTAGTASGGSVTSTLSYTWTATTTNSNVQVQCINTELHTGSNVVLVYEFNFGPASFVSGNTLSITDTLTAT